MLPEDKMASKTKYTENNSHSREQLIESYKKVRQFSHILAEPLEIEDYVVQSMPDVSPTKWHLAHTSWFFEAFVLEKFDKKYEFVHVTISRPSSAKEALSDFRIVQ